MRCDVTEDPGRFWAWAEPFLVRDPVVNGVLLTNVLQRVAGTVVDPAPPTFVAVRGADGAVIGVAMRTLPTEAYVSPLPGDAVAPLAGALREACPSLSGIRGTDEDAEAVARALWDAFERVLAQRIYVLAELAARPAFAGGSGRPTTPTPT